MCCYTHNLYKDAKKISCTVVFKVVLYCNGLLHSTLQQISNMALNVIDMEIIGEF